MHKYLMQDTCMWIKSTSPKQQKQAPSHAQQLVMGVASKNVYVN